MPMIGLEDAQWAWTRESAPSFEPGGEALSWDCEGGTDYWRITSSGTIAHNGHARLVEVDGSFTLEAEFEASLSAQYDQVGFLVLKSPEEWFKGGFEYDGQIFAGGVFTRGTSDWSLTSASLPARLRLTRKSGTLELSWRAADGAWSLLRQFTLEGPVRAGFYSAAPTGRGFRATIRGLRFEAESQSPSGIDGYVAGFPPEVRARLEQVRLAIRDAAPGAEETISYRMPTFTLGGILVHFAAQKQHIGFYPTPSGIEQFKTELSGYKTSKGAIQFPFDRPIPVDLIKRIVRFRVEENLDRRKRRS